VGWWTNTDRRDSSTCRSAVAICGNAPQWVSTDPPNHATGRGEDFGEEKERTGVTGQLKELTSMKAPAKEKNLVAFRLEVMVTHRDTHESSSAKTSGQDPDYRRSWRVAVAVLGALPDLRRFPSSAIGIAPSLDSWGTRPTRSNSDLEFTTSRRYGSRPQRTNGVWGCL